jgi:hypothetical protein
MVSSTSTTLHWAELLVRVNNFSLTSTSHEAVAIEAIENPNSALPKSTVAKMAVLQMVANSVWD